MRGISRKCGVSPNTVKKYLNLNGKQTETQNIIHEVRKKDDLLRGLYLGIWAGDGTQYLDNGYRIKIFCDRRNNELIEFYRQFMLQFFGKTIRVVKEKFDNRAFVIFGSKFIYNFVYDFLDFGRNKTYTVCLKNPVSSYSEQFLKGFLLGLMLTDGYLKQKFYFNTTSENLAYNVIEILEKFGLNPRRYVHDRKKYGWKDLHMVTLKKEDSSKVLNLLDSIIKETGCKKSFSELKGY